uniref:RING-CH-type domain-containing protein n=1 Tax=Palpitomonas bilix TaxID=652834 RepID=A0A7S3D3G6_9EUKA|mmetsp:Transcript_19586/g.50187  ORF Transcript_19586/g.50187 Transcript_19586/m.50187 type:complete len:293 (+) Transcript_19586:223-1101(+)
MSGVPQEATSVPKGSVYLIKEEQEEDSSQVSKSKATLEEHVKKWPEDNFSTPSAAISGQEARIVQDEFLQDRSSTSALDRQGERIATVSHPAHPFLESSLRRRGVDHTDPTGERRDNLRERETKESDGDASPTHMHQHEPGVESGRHAAATVMTTEPLNCCVCLESTGEIKQYCLCSPANKSSYFHRECIDMWELSNGICTFCKSPYTNYENVASPVELVTNFFHFLVAIPLYIIKFMLKMGKAVMTSDIPLPFICLFLANSYFNVKTYDMFVHPYRLRSSAALLDPQASYS